MQKELTLPSHDITRLQRILEATDGLAVLKTLNGKEGKALLIFPDGNKQEVADLLQGFAREYQIKI